MKNLDERVFDYLNDAGRPLTIGEILKEKAFKDVSRQELSRILKQLQLGNEAFRKVIDGKAYYSTDPSYGEGKNPSQAFISGFTNKLNRALNSNTNQKDIELAHLLNAITPEDDPDLKTDSSKLNLTYSQNKRTGGAKYSIAIPDDYVLIENEGDRDFVAYSKAGSDGDDYSNSDIVFYAGVANESNNFNQFRSQESREAICVRLMKEMMSSSPIFRIMFQENVVLPFRNEITAGAYTRAYSNNTIHVNAVCIVPGGSQMFRIQINDVTTKDYEKCDELIQGWLKTFQPKGEMSKLTLMTDSKLKDEPLNNKLADHIMEVAEENRTDIFTTQNARINSAILDFKNEQNEGGGSVIRLKKQCRSILEDTAVKVQDLYQKLIGVFMHHNGKNCDDDSLYSLYTKIVEWINQETEASLTLDDDKISVKYTNVPTFLETLQTDRIDNIVKEKKEAERRKKELQKKKKNYDEAVKLIQSGTESDLRKAVAILEKIPDYNDSVALKESSENKIDDLVRKEKDRKNTIYDKAAAIVDSSDSTLKDLEKAYKDLESIAGYTSDDNSKNANVLKISCIELIKKTRTFNEAVKLASDNTLDSLKNAVEKLKTIRSFKDSEQKINEYEIRIKGIEEEIERKKAEKLAEEKRLAKARRNRRILICLTGILLIAGFAFYILKIVPENNYKSAIAMMNEGNYDDAIASFEDLQDYKESQEMIFECKYQKAQVYFNSGDIDDALSAFEDIRDYKDSSDKIFECKYLNAQAYFDSGDIDNALLSFEDIKDYKDSSDKLLECQYLKAQSLVEQEKYSDALYLQEKFEKNLTKTEEYASSIKMQIYNNALSMKESKKYEKAIEIFKLLSEYNYEDCDKQIKICEALPYANAEAKDVIIFGNYNGKALTWRVLTRNANSVLLITESCVDERHFQKNQNDPKYYINSPIRNYLNERFLQEAFNDSERNLIETHNLPTTGGNVSDKVFLLSADEAARYFDSDAERISEDKTTWFLRTANPVKLAVLNHIRTIPMKVNSKGEVYQYDWTTDYKEGIRPAIWVDISSYVRIANE